jgi:hypothetical protein
VDKRLDARNTTIIGSILPDIDHVLGLAMEFKHDIETLGSFVLGQPDNDMNYIETMLWTFIGPIQSIQFDFEDIVDLIRQNRDATLKIRIVRALIQRQVESYGFWKVALARIMNGGNVNQEPTTESRTGMKDDLNTTQESTEPTESHSYPSLNVKKPNILQRAANALKKTAKAVKETAQSKISSIKERMAVRDALNVCEKYISKMDKYMNQVTKLQRNPSFQGTLNKLIPTIMDIKTSWTHIQTHVRNNAFVSIQAMQNEISCLSSATENTKKFIRQIINILQKHNDLKTIIYKPIQTSGAAKNSNIFMYRVLNGITTEKLYEAQVGLGNAMRDFRATSGSS